MNDYTPQAGDSVKLTGKANPDNVLFGTVIIANDNLIIGIGGAENPLYAARFIDWSIEPWVKPVTFKPFAIVRLVGGVVVRAEDNGSAWVDGWSDKEIEWELNHNAAEILFEGVDQ